jgi:hypothetical protein
MVEGVLVAVLVISLGISLLPVRSMVAWLISALTFIATFLLLVGRLALTGAWP